MILLTIDTNYCNLVDINYGVKLAISFFSTSKFFRNFYIIYHKNKMINNFSLNNFVIEKEMVFINDFFNFCHKKFLKNNFFKIILILVLKIYYRYFLLIYRYFFYFDIFFKNCCYRSNFVMTFRVFK